MHSKKQISINFLDKKNILICPYCKTDLVLNNQIISCENNHNFDISKKGDLFLIDTKKYKPSKIYNKELFTYRRKFIEKDFYSKVYDFISSEINSYDYKNLNILDLGCGEGLHSKKIQERIKTNNSIYGIDYSKDAINMATDYLECGNLYFTADVNNIPIKNNSIDVVIDFLSPFNTSEINRILKDNGYIIKIVPGDSYLKELRAILNMNNYEKKEEVKRNILKNFNIIKEQEIIDNFPLNDDDLLNLVNMTPLNPNQKIINNQINNITINVIIYILRKK